MLYVSLIRQDKPPGNFWKALSLENDKTYKEAIFDTKPMDKKRKYAKQACVQSVLRDVEPISWPDAFSVFN